MYNSAFYYLQNYEVFYLTNLHYFWITLKCYKRDKLCHIFGLPYRSVLLWFIRERQRDRKKELQIKSRNLWNWNLLAAPINYHQLINLRPTSHIYQTNSISMISFSKSINPFEFSDFSIPVQYHSLHSWYDDIDHLQRDRIEHVTITFVRVIINYTHLLPVHVWFLLIMFN